MRAPSDSLYFLMALPLLWFGVTAILSLLSGWFRSMNRYPDRDESATIALSSQSGSLGPVSMRGVLKLSVCSSGLRVYIVRILFVYAVTSLCPGAKSPLHARIAFSAVTGRAPIAAEPLQQTAFRV